MESRRNGPQLSSRHDDDDDDHDMSRCCAFAVDSICSGFVIQLVLQRSVLQICTHKSK